MLFHLHTALKDGFVPHVIELSVLNHGLPIDWTAVQEKPDEAVPVRVVRCKVIRYNARTMALVFESNDEDFIHSVMNSPDGPIEMGVCPE